MPEFYEYYENDQLALLSGKDLYQDITCALEHDPSSRVPISREAIIQKKQALRSSCELLRTKDSKRLKKEQTGPFRNLQEPSGTACNLL
ncbi:MAG: hypothetical protein GY737_10580 [Desulfobacteraceae bacterium]|nr:hypothetical protein [Desulfobacteraceae bacterium]